MLPLVDIRVHTKISQAELDEKVGRIVTESDYNVRLTGPTRVSLPNGQPIVIYLPGIIPDVLAEAAYPILHPIREKTDQRHQASGSQSVQVGTSRKGRNVASSILGSFESDKRRFPYCRQTAWTGKNTEQFRELYPLFGFIGERFAEYVPQRYGVQWDRAEATEPAFRIPGTPFTTITVNNTYPTGVHTDKGDLDEGFSCLAVLRRGDYTGGVFTFPEYRLAVDLQDCDLLLMDAHQWHGNTDIQLHSEDAERISVVLYYRTNMLSCGTPAEELAKGKRANRTNKRVMNAG
jgi:hypothetical protein